MSHSYYNRLWDEAQLAVGDMLEIEVPPKPPKPEKDPTAFFQLLATMYIKYIQSFRRLEDCYDQIVHPQKRRLLRHLLDGVMGRLLEIKHQMVDVEKSDYHFIDDVLSDLKYTPNDIEIPIPRYFVRERVKALREREALLGSILAKLGPQEKQQEEVMTFQDAVHLLQIHERARQGRLRTKFMKEIKADEEKERRAQEKGAPKISTLKAATIIQKIYRGYYTRKKSQKERDEEFVFLGMAPPPPLPAKFHPQTIVQDIEEKRHVVQDVHENEYQTALTTIKDKIMEAEGPLMKETMMDQVRQWFLECRDITGKFPEYPDDDDGGSAKIFELKDPSVLEKELEEAQENKGKKSGKKSAKGKKGKKDKKSAKKDKKGKKGKSKDDDEEDGWLLAPSQFVPTVNEASGNYKGVWLSRDESQNQAQKYDAELIREEKRREVEVEIRRQVDEIMRHELNSLKLAVDREKVGKKKSAKKKKKKGKKSGKKGKKGKREKDLTPDRTIESLYEELVTEGIIQRCPQVRMTDYLGEYSFLGSTLRLAGTEPQPSLADVRRLVTEYAIVPLGSLAIHEKAPLIKSILLAGPYGVGKRMLIHAVCTEAGANLINLTAANIAGKYPGKDGLKMLMHMVLKVGRAYQPSVILINDAEMMYKKKVPKGDPTDPKRLKKELPKMLKLIKVEDRVLIMGTSCKPFEGELKPMFSAWQKTILIPRADYASRHLIWRFMIPMQNGIINSIFDISSLAKVSDGYTPGMIKQACSEILNDRRIKQQKKRAIVPSEFLVPLSRINPVYKEEEEQFKSWFEKSPLGKARARLAAGDDDDGKGKKGKKGKKSAKKSGKKKK